MFTISKYNSNINGDDKQQHCGSLGSTVASCLYGRTLIKLPVMVVSVCPTMGRHPFLSAPMPLAYLHWLLDHWGPGADDWLISNGTKEPFTMFCPWSCTLLYGILVQGTEQSLPYQYSGTPSSTLLRDL